MNGRAGLASELLTCWPLHQPHLKHLFPPPPHVLVTPCTLLPLLPQPAWDPERQRDNHAGLPDRWAAQGMNHSLRDYYVSEGHGRTRRSGRRGVA